MKYKRWNKKDCSIQKISFQSHRLLYFPLSPYLKEAYDIYYSLIVFIGIVNENSFIYLSHAYGDSLTRTIYLVLNVEENLHPQLLTKITTSGLLKLIIGCGHSS